jgi:hypothetical protein
MEDKLWEMGLLGDSDPSTLLNTMIYVLGLHFALRGRDEHRRLRSSQLTVRAAHDGRRYLEYREVSFDKLKALGLQVKIATILLCVVFAMLSFSLLFCYTLV